jgi:hypothetical protein
LTVGLKTEQRSIDGKNYIVTQFPAGRALRIWHRLVKLVGPALGTAFGGIKNDDKSILDARFDFSVIGTAIEKLTGAMSEDEFHAFTLELLQMTSQDGKEINKTTFDVLFQGEIAHLFKVLAFVLEVNFKDFYSALAGKLMEVRAGLKAKKLSKSKESESESGQAG